MTDPGLGEFCWIWLRECRISMPERFFVVVKAASLIGNNQPASGPAGCDKTPTVVQFKNDN
ncbi:hypothetical protein [Rheinheimera mangrovi]|uniref:hypothetical protein n=1 Tax=Rheinheimera mangrovi TaxID=2498451 RepID=UPI000F8E0E90|nr:hypothetical protein [Rheinheimera mangrovi]